jgi:hypothetical protein
MPYIDLQHLSATEFKRLCGVRRETFNEMVEVLRPELERQGRRGGQNKLSVEDQLLVTLEYWREYGSQFHIATTWGLHETTVGRTIKKVEDLPDFSRYLLERKILPLCRPLKALSARGLFSLSQY